MTTSIMWPALAKQEISRKADVFHFICTILHDQYRPYPMHSTRQNVNSKHIIHNKAHRVFCVFMSDFLYNSWAKVSLSYWKGIPQLLDRNAPIVADKSSLHCWFLLTMRNLSLWLLVFARTGHIWAVLSALIAKIAVSACYFIVCRYISCIWYTWLTEKLQCKCIVHFVLYDGF